MTTTQKTKLKTIADDLDRIMEDIIAHVRELEEIDGETVSMDTSLLDNVAGDLCRLSWNIRNKAR